ncbi:MAG: DUF4838 domain-containing protein [Kiritimatiellae bacterium]|nr:DUF4838 domain-containing protein [Kiritimatiellia bacterium]
MRTSTIVALAGIGMTLHVRAGELTLVKDGRPNARIVVGADVCKVARFAARELQAYIEKATGATLPIERELGNDGRPDIVVGAGSIAAALGVTTEGLGRDAYVIRTAGNRLVILGRDDPKKDLAAALSSAGGGWHDFEHATVFGVYEFLERFLGVRWYLPIELGEVVPKRTTLVIPPADLRDGPAKISRHIHTHYGADDRDDPPPKKRNGAWRGGYRPGFEGEADKAFNRRRNLHFVRLRHETVQIASNHSLSRLIPAKRFKATHPEFYALYANGKRGFGPGHDLQHCHSCEGLIQVLIEDAKAYFRGEDAKARGIEWGTWGGIGWESPRGKVFNILQNDGYRPCTCENCRKWRGEDGPAEKRRSEADLVWNLVFRIAEAVKDEFPDCYVSGTAYGPMAKPPRRKFLPNMLVSRLAVAGPYTEFSPRGTKGEDDRIKAWTDIVGKQGLAFYHYANKGGWESGHYYSHRSICGSVPRAYAGWYSRNKDIGIGTYMYQLSHRYAYDHLSTYVFYKYHWDPNRDIDALLDEYFTLFYGPAAGPMGKYWEEVEQQFRKTLAEIVETPLGPQAKTPDEHDVWGIIYGEPVMRRWAGYFEEAARLAARAADPIYAERVAYMKRNVFDTQMEGRAEFERLVADVEKIRLKVKRTAMPPKLDGTLDDPAWQAATPAGFVVMDTREKPEHPTTVRALWDDANLYMAIECIEPELDAMLADETVNDRSSVWRNNGVELFWDPANTGRSHYQLILNSKGTWFDGGKGLSHKNWNSNFKGTVKEHPDRYIVEIAVPFASFSNPPPKAGQTWAGSILRKRVKKGQTMGQAAYQTWSPYVSTEIGFHRGLVFGKLDFVD